MRPQWAFSTVVLSIIAGLLVVAYVYFAIQAYWPVKIVDDRFRVMSTDKKCYKPGDTVWITHEVADMTAKGKYLTLDAITFDEGNYLVFSDEPLSAPLSPKEKLKELDLASLRCIREYIAAKEDAPQYIKDYEEKVVAERSKIASTQSKVNGESTQEKEGYNEKT